MKHNKLFRTLGIGIFLCLLVIAMPVTPALAQSIVLTPTSGTAGTTVTVTGTGFTSYTTETVYILFDDAYIASAYVGSAGTFSASFQVPSSYTTAMTVPVTVQHTTSVYDATKQIAIAYFSVTVAEAEIVVSPSSGYVGDQITVSGSGFTASSSVTIYFDTTNLTTITTDAYGGFTNATFTVPESYRGSHTIKAQDTSGHYATTTLTVLPKITLTPTSGAVEDTVTISGTGFAANSGVTFEFDNVSVSAATTTTNANGSFTNVTFSIPSSSRGSHTVKAEDASGNYATATLTVLPKITLTPTSGASGTTVMVTGTGFSASKPITIKYNAASVTTDPAAINTDATGSFTASFNVPAGLAGTYSVEATDGTYSDSTSFVATVDAAISPTTSETSPGYVGMELTINGTGLKPNATVTITYTTEPVVLATVTTDEDGDFSVAVTIPPSVGGNHTITVTDDHTTKQFTFVMESEAPPIPVPLLPETDTRAKSQAYFDWEDLDDPGGVTYTLQIAFGADFNNIVLEKAGVTDSEYTVTKEEKLSSVSKEEPYYWRIRAIDGASNESEWSAAGSFYVRSAFSMPQWAIYLLCGLGALLLGCLGFWLGRRTAY